jgi:hypothetical protein
MNCVECLDLFTPKSLDSVKRQNHPSVDTRAAVAMCEQGTNIIQVAVILLRTGTRRLLGFFLVCLLGGFRVFGQVIMLVRQLMPR